MPAGPAAEAAQTLTELRAAIAGFAGCGLKATATNLVFADGNPTAGLLIVGGAPSAAEDRSGRAFEGPGGVYLERMLQSVGIGRDMALLTPLIPWRPPGDRPPTAAEIGACLPFLHRLIALTAPRRVLLLGPLAARAFLGAAPRRKTPDWLPASIPGLLQPVPALPMAAPETLLAKPAGRRDAWGALRLLRRTLDRELTVM
jgi:DNA polymerase